VAFPAEQKLLLVPLVFIFLRVWDIVDDVLTVYYHTDIGGGDKLLWLQILTVSDIVFMVHYRMLVDENFDEINFLVNEI